MGGTFNPQILMEKLSKLNSSQQSIETLSHWCIFHMNKAKFVVDTWARQFHCSRRDQKLAFLYLANDILQNSRRKGVEFVGEFWRVLPDALRDVIKNGDDAGIKAARRLISIWDERKVFGSRGHILKEEFVARQSENSDRTGRQPQPNLKLRQPTGSVIDKVVSDYDMLSGGEVAEDALLSRCTSTISSLEKIVKDLGSGANSGKINGSGSAEKLQGQHASLRECMEQLTALESSRASFVSLLRDVLYEQELKLGRVRSQLQAAHVQSSKATNICKYLQLDLDGQGSSLPPGFTSGDNQASPIVYTRQSPLSTDKAAPDPSEDDSLKTTAAEVAAKLTASDSSAEMLSLALTSLVSEVTFGNSNGDSISSGPQESPADRPLEKRPKLENDPPFYAPPPPPPLPPPPPPPLPPLPENLDSPQQNTDTTSPSQQMTPDEQPPPPTSSPDPPLPPLYQIPPPIPRPPQFFPTSGPMAIRAFTYGIRPPVQQPFSGPVYVPMARPMMVMPPYGPPPIPFQNYQVPEGGMYNPSSLPMTSHQQSS